MDDGIHFGEVEQAAPEGALRPDENRHYAVVAYGEPQERDLPIFVDLDVLADMEEHAQSDTSVELGGVLLGSYCEDSEGRPFVVVTDSLRAQHYESTKGSFKFTHDTWSAITREREQFPAEIQMVGWYHTHPDWGVFLSGMDMFICDNFFNKKLDVAYVIDPCRGDRGMFQWTGDERQRVRRTGGFFVTASRFRAAELEYYVAELSGAMPATITSRGTAGPSSAPVVHLHQPQRPDPQWQGIAVVGMLALQFLLVALIAWKTLTPPVGAAAGEDRIAAELEKWRESQDALRAVDLARERNRAQAQVLDQVVSELKGTDGGFVSRLQDRFDQTGKLTDDVAARDAHIRELQSRLTDSESRLKGQEAKSKIDEGRLTTQIDGLKTENVRLQADLKRNKEQVAALRDKYEPKSVAAKAEEDGDAAQKSASLWWWIGGAALLAIVVVAGVWWIGGQRAESPPEPADEKQPEAT